jgi:hypothetical protein
MPKSADYMTTFLSHVSKTESGCWLWLGATRGDQYGACKFRKKAEGVHRVSWILHFGEIPAGKVVMHTCDVRLCVNPEHLRLGTSKENWEDAVKKGRMAPHRTLVTEPLSPETIQEIVRRYEACVSFKVLVLEYNVPPTSLRRLLIKHSRVYRTQAAERKRTNDSRTTAGAAHGGDNAGPL